MGASITTTAIQAIQVPVTLLSMLGFDGGEILYPAQTNLQNNSYYDYIVVGGGSAGCVVTTRLAEDKNNSVLLLEYGDDPSLTALAAGLFVLLPKSSVDYNYMSTYDPYAASSHGNYTTLTCGKMLGGSDSLNHLIHTRGCTIEYNQWAEITGDDSWNYTNFLPYFIKSENTDDSALLEAYPEYHGTNGPMILTRELSDDVTKYLEAFAEVGVPTVLDLNANEHKGYTQPQLMIGDKTRQTPARSYLKMVKDNSNLHVSKNTRVTKVIFENKVAVAVEAVYEGKTYVLRANKEIILSAGVFNTPQILMLSGVGPKDHLEEKGIEVIADLPVGNNFTEQVAVILAYKTVSHLLPLFGITEVNPDVTQMSFPVIAGSVALNDSQECPDYQTYGLLLGQDLPLLTVACHDIFWYRNDICDRLQNQVSGRDSLFTLLANVAPLSRGTVRLNSTDPFDDPVIKTGLLTDSRDVENMVKYVKNFIKVGSSSYFKEIGAELVGLDLPACADEESGSDDFWRCYVKNMAGVPYHYTGTCAMGSVIDGSLKLKGFENIRVIDASSIPVTPRGAPNAAVIALAEKGADIIKNAK